MPGALRREATPPREGSITSASARTPSSSARPRRSSRALRARARGRVRLGRRRQHRGLRRAPRAARDHAARAEGRDDGAVARGADARAGRGGSGDGDGLRHRAGHRVGRARPGGAGPSDARRRERRRERGESRHRRRALEPVFPCALATRSPRRRVALPRARGGTNGRARSAEALGETPKLQRSPDADRTRREGKSAGVVPPGRLLARIIAKQDLSHCPTCALDERRERARFRALFARYLSLESAVDLLLENQTLDFLCSPNGRSRG